MKCAGIRKTSAVKSRGEMSTVSGLFGKSWKAHSVCPDKGVKLFHNSIDQVHGAFSIFRRPKVIPDQRYKYSFLPSHFKSGEVEISDTIRDRQHVSSSYVPVCSEQTGANLREPRQKAQMKAILNRVKLLEQEKKNIVRVSWYSAITFSREDVSESVMNRLYTLRKSVYFSCSGKIFQFFFALLAKKYSYVRSQITEYSMELLNETRN